MGTAPREAQQARPARTGRGVVDAPGVRRRVRHGRGAGAAAAFSLLLPPSCSLEQQERVMNCDTGNQEARYAIYRAPIVVPGAAAPAVS